MKMLPINTLRTMTPDAKKKLALDATKAQKKLTDLTESHKSAFPAVGKLVCVFEEDLNALKSATPPKIASNTSLAQYWESITGTKINPHWYSCAVAFGTFVRTDLITEADYDKNTAQCLELSAAISNKVGGDITHAAILEVADELKDRSKDCAANLRAILERLKGPAELSGTKAKEMLARIIAAGHLTTVVIPAIGAEIAHIEDSETARSALLGLDVAVEMFATNTDENNQRRFTDDVMAAWRKADKEAKAAPAVAVTHGEGEEEETPAPAPAATGGKRAGKKPAAPAAAPAAPENITPVPSAEPTAVAA